MPVIQTAIGERIPFQQIGVMDNSPAVVIAVVVALESFSDVLKAATTNQITRGRMNGIPRIANVTTTANPRFRPSRR